MTIKLNPDATFPAEVSIHIRGREEPARATFTFRVLDEVRLARLLIVLGFGQRPWYERAFERLRMAWRLRRWPNLADVLDELIAGWSGFDLPYSKDSLSKLLLAFEGVSVSIVSAYVGNRQEARLKN